MSLILVPKRAIPFNLLSLFSLRCSPPPSPLTSIAVLARYHTEDNDANHPVVLYEMNEIETSLANERGSATSWRTLVATPGNRKRMRVILGIAFFSQWSGNGLVSSVSRRVLTLLLSLLLITLIFDLRPSRFPTTCLTCSSRLELPARPFRVNFKSGRHWEERTELTSHLIRFTALYNGQPRNNLYSLTLIILLILRFPYRYLATLQLRHRRRRSVSSFQSTRRQLELTLTSFFRPSPLLLLFPRPKLPSSAIASVDDLSS